jgi:serine 3-dehydrogenase
MSITQRHALVIGASSGIGAATAIDLSSHGWNVTAVARRQDRLVDMVRHHTRIKMAVVDVTSAAELQKTIDHIGPIDVLVYAAGWNFPERELSVLTTEDWHQAFSVNVDGAFTATQAVLPQMRRNGGGVIVYISSISAAHADASGAAYQASKRALHGLAEATSFEEGQHGIRVSLVMPGLTRTEFNSLRRTPPTEEARSKFMAPEDVAAAVTFICELPAHLMIPELTIVPTINPWNR